MVNLGVVVWRAVYRAGESAHLIVAMPRRPIWYIRGYELYE